MIARLRRDPALALLLLALALTIAVYAPTLGRGLIDYDDPWLIGDNTLLHHPSWHSLHTIFLDLSGPTRYRLGAEYLPIRDLSILVDFTLWGDWYPGFHLTNLVVYLASIVLWFAALGELGVDRRIAGVAALVWALHPSHAESVAWLSERKGLLAAMFAGACALGFARFRAGGRARWLAVAVVAAVAAVWSKAPAAFAIAALAGLELALPARRVSWKRSAVGLGAIAAACALAFAPVVAVALDMAVVAGDDRAPASWLAMVLGLHGAYVQIAAMAVANAISYPIRTHGPSALELVLGALALAAALAIALAPRLGRWKPPAVARAAAVLWLFGWFPASRLVLPVRKVMIADRYLLLATLGVALAIAAGVLAISSRRARVALVAAVVVAAGLRTLDAQARWADPIALWQRALRSNPDDGDAWSVYADELASAGDQPLADHAVAEGLTHSHAPKLLLRDALFAIGRGQRAAGISRLREAADAGEPYAMSDLALVIADTHPDEALAWAQRSIATAPEYPSGYISLGRVALVAHRPDLALPAFAHGFAYEPTLTNWARFVLTP